jgi:hypothetical protein
MCSTIALNIIRKDSNSAIAVVSIELKAKRNESNEMMITSNSPIKDKNPVTLNAINNYMNDA